MIARAAAPNPCQILLALALLMASPLRAGAICDVIPQVQDVYRGAVGSVDRPFGSVGDSAPGDTLEISLDLAGCDSGNPGFQNTTALSEFPFAADAEGWTLVDVSSGALPLSFVPSGGNPGGFVEGVDSGSDAARFVAPPGFGGDWAALLDDDPVLSFDLKVSAGGGSLGTIELVEIDSGATSFCRVRYLADVSSVPVDTWVHFEVPIDAAEWDLVGLFCGGFTFGDLLADVERVEIQGDIRNGPGETMALDNVRLSVPDEVVLTKVYPAVAGSNAAAFVYAPDASLCGAPDFQTKLSACQTALGAGGQAFCNAWPTTISGPDRLSFRIQDTAYEGPTKLAVTPLSDALPCQLATLSCTDPGAPADLRACIDTLYEDDSTCGTSSAQVHPVFGSFTTLSSPNDFAAHCSSADPDSPCTGAEPGLQIVPDADGNLLIPMAWSKVLVPGAIPIPRIVEGSTTYPAFSGGPDPLAVPGSSFLSSHSPRGHRVPPLFTPIADPDGGPRLLGSVDAERGVIRIARRGAKFGACDGGDRDGGACNVDAECPNGGTCGPGTCQAGSNAGNLCVSDAQCPGSECGPSLFELRDRVGPFQGTVIVDGTDYDAEAQTPVAIDALLETADAIVTLRSEPLEGPDLNGDDLPDGVDLNGDSDLGDTTVVSARLKAENTPVMLGAGGTATGDAVVRSRQDFYTVAGIASDDEHLAFVQTEAATNIPLNGDDDILDYLVEAVRFPEVEALVSGVAADGAPRIDSATVALSDGLLFWREPEWDGPVQTSSFITLPAYVSEASDDGRYVIFESDDPLLVPDGDSDDDIYVLDRDSDADGIYDEVGATAYVQVSRHPDGSQPAGIDFGTGPIRISRNGRFALFKGSDLFSPGSGLLVLYVHDRDVDGDGIFDEPGQTSIASMSISETGLGTSVTQPSYSISDDGRYVVFGSQYDPLTGVLYSFPDIRVWVRDRDADEDGLFDDEGDGLDPGEISTYGLGPETAGGEISADGRWILALERIPPRAIPDKAFVTENAPGAPRVSLATDVFGDLLGGQTIPFSSFTGAHSFSADGRFAALDAYDSNGLLIPSGSFVRDRDPNGDGFDDEESVFRISYLNAYDGAKSQLRSLTRDGRFAAGAISGGLIQRHDVVTGVTAEYLNRPTATGNGSVHISQDGREVLYDDGVGSWTAVRPDLSDLSFDRNGDGDVLDTVLRVADLRTIPGVPLGDPVPPPTTSIDLPAGDVWVADGNALFLVPEAEAGADLDGDFDLEDEVAHLWLNRQPGPPVNLGAAALAGGVSSSHLAVIDAATGHVRVSPVAGAPSFTDLGIPAVDVQVEGSDVTFVGDDGLLYVYDAALAAFVMGPGGIPPIPVADAVAGEGIVAFRVSEPIFGDANFDGDSTDAVMHVLDVATGQLLNTEFAAIPCPTEACDPTRPYTVESGKVRFLTLETQQANAPTGCGGAPVCDLDGDGLGTSLVLQNFNASAALAGATSGEATRVVGQTAAGICTDTGEPCAESGQCPLGTCFLPPGGCIRDLGSACTIGATSDSCPAGQFCVPFPGDPGNGTCFVREGDCNSDAQCTAPAFCSEEGANFQRLVAAVEGRDGGELFFGAGKCLGPAGAACSLDADCGADERCHDGSCRDVDDSCRADADCSEAFTCERVAIVAGSGDEDGDFVADGLDNCPVRANPDQMDSDGDGIGDLCDRETCGNGVQEYAETCDDGNLAFGDGCDEFCQLEGVVAACANGLDDDGDGEVDLADGGCTDAADTSERDPAIECDDGIDNDGDGRSDYSPTGDADPGCKNALSTSLEAPQCSDGIDNDGDGKVDFAGGPFGEEPDPQCANRGPFKNREAKKVGCGLGYELAALLLLIARMRRFGRSALRRIPVG